jgi:hypothetical protein
MGSLGYAVWCPDFGQVEADGFVVRAPCPEDAAIGWAERMAQRDPEYVSTFIDHGADVFARLAGSPEAPSRYHVRGEPDVYYRAVVQP